MKKLMLIAGVLMIAYVLLTAAYEPGVEPVSGAMTESVATAPTDDVYTLTEVDGRVAVLYNSALYLKTDVPVSVLPKADILRLKEGVAFDSIEELKRALEDYCG